VLKGFINLLKNKVFSISLLAINTITFVTGLVIGDINLMLLAVFSYAAILLGMEINKDSLNSKDDD